MNILYYDPKTVRLPDIMESDSDKEDEYGYYDS